jgi:hypothetical protein
MKPADLARKPVLQMTPDRSHWQMTYTPQIQLEAGPDADPWTFSLYIRHDWTAAEDEYQYFACNHAQTLRLFKGSDFDAHAAYVEAHGEQVPDTDAPMAAIPGAAAAFDAMIARFTAINLLVDCQVNW